MIENYFTMTRADLLPSLEDQTIAKITITAKEDISTGNIEIYFTNMKFTMEDEKSFEIDDRVLELQIVESQEQDADNKKEDENQNDDEKEDEDYKEDTDEKNENDEISDKNNEAIDNKEVENTENTSKQLITTNSSSNKVLPYTGILGTGGIVLIVILLILAYVSYRKYKNWKKI